MRGSEVFEALEGFLPYLQIPFNTALSSASLKALGLRRVPEPRLLGLLIVLPSAETSEW